VSPLGALGLAGLALLVGAAFGYLLAALRASRAGARLGAELEAARARLQGEAQREAGQRALLERAELQLRAAFDDLAAATLRNNSETFLQVARESLGRDRDAVQADLREREAAISNLLAPIHVALEQTAAQVATLERERRDAFATLRTQIESLASGQSTLARETRNLVTALRRPEVRGRWGELTLRRVVELAGLANHCDFTEQPTVLGADGALRPDLVVHMPEERDLVIDAKTPLDAYLEALEAGSEEARAAALRRHALQVEAQVRALASKSYWSQFERSPEFAVLFLPGDQFLSAALAESPDLLDDALRQSVIIATPSTLIALLKAVAYGWRQAEVARNAATIRDLGQELHRRLATFAQHLSKLGRSLGVAVESYNAAVGSLERSVLPQSRRFAELGVTTEAPIPELNPLDLVPRVPQHGSEDSA
jgi:DNA recombination protein RmuC